MSMTFKQFAVKVLEQTAQPLTSMQIWEKGVTMGLDKVLASGGKTPWATLSAQLGVDVRDNENSAFVRLGKPAHFYLKARQAELAENIEEMLETAAEAAETQSGQQSLWHERDLHPLLAYFTNSNVQFNRGRNLYSKTIFHESSKKTGFNEWLHPDMVGFYIPIEWQDDLLNLNKITDNNSLKLFSFELKKRLSKGNYREAFFQAVSNSSWAHEGYLAAASISENVMEELERLSLSFGIGIIALDLDNIEASSILFHPQRRENLDWETMNKLAKSNPDFKRFLQNIKIDFESRRIHKEEYDAVLKDPIGYIEQKQMTAG